MRNVSIEFQYSCFKSSPSFGHAMQGRGTPLRPLSSPLSARISVLDHTLLEIFTVLRLPNQILKSPTLLFWFEEKKSLVARWGSVRQTFRANELGIPSERYLHEPRGERKEKKENHQNLLTTLFVRITCSLSLSGAQRINESRLLFTLIVCYSFISILRLPHCRIARSSTSTLRAAAPKKREKERKKENARHSSRSLSKSASGHGPSGYVRDE